MSAAPEAGAGIGGGGSVPAPPPVVLLHGFTGGADAWGAPIVHSLARGRRVIAVDLPGHRSGAVGEGERLVLSWPDGSTPAMEPRPDGSAGAEGAGATFEGVVRALVGKVSELGIDRADWVGYSMGGRIALAVALLAPAAVRRLVLESASPGLEDGEARARRREEDEVLALRLERDGMAPFVDDWLGRPLFASQGTLPAEVRSRERARRLLQDPAGLAEALRRLGTGRQPWYGSALPQVRAPVLLLTGAEDAKFREIARRMVSGIPSAHHREIAGAGHAVHLERPEAWLDAVLPFLDDGAG